MATVEPPAVPAEPDDIVEFPAITDADAGPEPVGIWDSDRDFWVSHYQTQ